MTIYNDPKKGFFVGKGRHSTLDPQAKLDFVAECRNLAFPTLHNNVIMADIPAEANGEAPDLKPRPPKRAMIKKLVQKGALETLARAGRVLGKNEKVKISRDTNYRIRRALTDRSKAKDLTDARYIALADFQHMFQSCIMICALYLFVSISGVVRYFTAEEKANFDCTAFKVDRNDTGQVI